MPDLTRQEVIKILAVTDNARLAGVDLSGLDLMVCISPELFLSERIYPERI